MRKEALLSPLLFGTSLVLLLELAAPASAYVRSYTTQGCHPVFWPQSCVYVTVDGDGVPELPLVEVERIVQQSITAWQTRTSGSSYLRLNYVSATEPRETMPRDGLQVIKFRTKTWCRPAEDPTQEANCYDPSAAALTTVTYINKPMDPTDDGRIIDADIEMNAVNNYFYDATTNPNPQTGSRRPADLWNTLTHELGHLQGLEHTCRRGAFDSMPLCTRDGNGQSVIQCGTVEQGRDTDASLQAIYDTTMYPTADPRETKKRYPRPDDIAGVINIYPKSSDPRLCKSPAAAVPKGGCSLAAPRSVADSRWLLLSGFGLLGLFALRPGRRRSPSASLAHPRGK